nr:hypothetical protein [Chroococcidiopsis sp. SAG 2025]
MEPFTPEYQLNHSQIEDLRLAASKLLGAARRSFQAEMALKYCGGSARLTETVFGWGRNNVELGLAEKRTGITCIGAQAAFGGNKALSRDSCRCDSFWRNPLLGRIPGFSRVTHQGLRKHFNPLLMTT